MKVKLTDQLHISEISPDTLAPDTIIDVSDSMAADLVKRGLATKVAAAPKNKAQPPAKNKAAGIKPISSTRAR